MRIVTCTEGHFYDADKHSLCPYCEKEIIIKNIPSRFRNLGSISSLGEGSTGKVFKISGEKEYALKIIRCGTDAARYQNALYELHIMERLKGQKQAVQLCDYEIAGEEGQKTIYFLEEYHKTMEDFLSGKTIFASDAVQIMLGICDALSAFKRLGILHLDVQPKNIFVDDTASVKLGDFSSSLFENDARSNHIMRGTMAFAAPEVYRNGKCSERSDIYSAGLILYFLFNKQVLPFMDSDSENVSVYKRLAGTPFPEISYANAEVEGELNRIVRKACAFDIMDRYPDTDALKTELSGLLKRINEFPAADEKLYSSSDYENNRILPVIYVLQTSGSMQGKPICELNYAVHETMEQIKTEAGSHNVEVRVSVLTFGNNVEWRVFNENIYECRFSFSASGFSQLGLALNELNKKLTRYGDDGLVTFGCCLPVIIFMTNGYAADDFRTPLSILRNNPLYEKAQKIGFALGDDYDLENISDLVGNNEYVLKSVDIEVFRKFVKFVSVYSIFGKLY